MIITRAPLRISFAGGGTDQPSFYRKFGTGIVVSTSINRYVYVTMNEKFDGKVSVRYRVHEIADYSNQIKHLLIREILRHYGVENGVEIVITSEVPARGSGLGASSAMAVALCVALERYTNDNYGNGLSLDQRKNLAEVAAKIEMEKVCSPIGKQDHYASAIGGFNCFCFNADDTVDLVNFNRDEFIEEIERQSMLFYLDIEHAYEGGRSFVQKILKEQVEEMESKSSLYGLQRDNAAQLRDHMEYAVIERFQDHVNENWRLKRSTHRDISSHRIDRIISMAYEAGAVAAKVCGAGGGGFLYLVVPTSMQDGVRGAMSDFDELKFGFDSKGVQIIFEEGRTVEADKQVH